MLCCRFGLRPALYLFVAVLAACSDDATGGDCGEGFRRVDGECVPAGRNDSGNDPSDDTGDGGADATPDTVADGDAGEGTCRELATRCRDELTPQVCAEAEWVDQEACGASDACENGRCVPRQACTPNEVAGCASDTAQRVCNEAGDLYVTRECDPGPFCFRGSCGTQVCEPGRRRCASANDLDVELCAGDGASWAFESSCDFEADQVCFEGECVSGCLASVKDPTYIGCEFWSVDLPQYQDPSGRDPRTIPHSVVLANTSERTAEVSVETQSGVTPPASVSIPPGGIQTLNFPRNDVEGTTLTNRSFRIQTTEPLVAYQFNPLNDAGVYSNDASLLLPASAIGYEYYVLSYPGGIAIPGVGPQTGWFTVVAASPGATNVTITFAADVVAGASSPLQGITAGTTRSFPISQWSVLNFECESRFGFPPRLNDLTGTHIVADQPIVVFAGHEEAVIGEEEPSDEGSNSVCCADHLEEQMIPVRSWGARYLAVHSPPRGSEDDFWRVIAAQPGTQISTVPAIDGLHGVTLGPGQWVEVATNQSFEVIATGPIQVAQYLVSQTAAGVDQTTGDPALILAVPVEQFREDYALLTPSGYARDYVTIIREPGTAITLDGALLTGATFAAVGVGDYEYTYVQWGAGVHRLTADAPFGVVMTGYDTAVSYGYPGGLNLDPRRVAP